MQKRGLSNIIATVLLVLLAIGAIALIWTFIGGIIGDSTSNTALQTKCLTETDLVVKSCTLETGKATVIVQLAKGDISGGTVILEDESGNAKTLPMDSENLPLQLETKSESVDFTSTELPGSIIKATVRATVKDSDGKELICEASSTPVTCLTSA